MSDSPAIPTHTRLALRSALRQLRVARVHLTEDSNSGYAKDCLHDVMTNAVNEIAEYLGESEPTETGMYERAMSDAEDEVVFENARGCAPDATEALSSEDFVRMNRDKWRS